METAQPPEVAPVIETTSDADSLKASFNAAHEALKPEPVIEANDATQKAADAKAAEAAKGAKKDESVVPAQFLKTAEEKKEVTTEKVDEPLATDEMRGKVKGEARAQFDKLEKAAKGRIEALQKEITELRAKPAAAGDSTELQSELKAERERVQKLQQDFERVAYTQSPKFARFGTDEKAELTAAKSYLEGSEVNPAILDAAAGTTGSERMKILKGAGLDAETIAVLSPHLARIDAIRRERDGSLENWKQTSEQDQQRAKAQQEAQHAQRIAEEKKVFDEVREQAKTMPAFTKVDGNDKWNALVEQNFKEAEDFFHGKKTLAELAELGHRGVAQRTTELINQELVKTVNEQNATIARLRAAQPSNGASGEHDAKKPAPDPVKDQTEHYKNSFNAAKAELATGR